MTRSTMRFARASALGLLAALASSASAQELVLTEERAPVAQARDVVFVAEGYRAGEQGEFRDAVRRFVDALEQDPHSPVRADRERWNVHAVFVPSRERAQPRRDAPRDTAMRMAARPSDGMLVCDAAAADVAASIAPDVDVVVVVGKFSFTFATPRASADYPPFGARVRIAEGDVGTLVHELGHAVYGLGDEYADIDQEIPADERRWVAYFGNLTCDPSGARFAGVAAPLVEGGAHYRRGVWRAERHCRMRASGSEAVGFCAPCRALIAGRPDVAPAAPAVTLEPGALRIDPGATSTRHDVVARRADGALVRLPIEGGPQRLDLAALLGPGAWTVEVRSSNVAGASAATVVHVGASGSSSPVVAFDAGLGIAGALR